MLKEPFYKQGRMKLLVTGATGYIGSHTVVDLLENGYDVVGIDNFQRSSPNTVEYIRERLGSNLYCVDLRDYHETARVLHENPDIDGIIHFAAHKSVEESVKAPLEYYDNNLRSLTNLLRVAGGRTVIFSSSCTVYGEPDMIPVTEDTPMKPAASPYGATKQMGERILRDWAESTGARVVLLRYFNPAGAHPSLDIGEDATPQSRNLVPLIVRAAAGRRGPLTVFGTDYPTRDGTCVRDFIHVCDLAAAHRKAFTYAQEEMPTAAVSVFNLGSGNGVTVQEAINAFETVTGVPVPHVKAERRPGDVSAIYADSSLAARGLNWKPVRSLLHIMQSAWDYDRKNPHTE